LAPISPRIGAALLLATLISASPHEAASHGTGHAEKPAQWELSASVIEASSGAADCSHATAHAKTEATQGGTDPEAPCRYNRAVKVDRGRFGETALGGARFWMAGEAGRNRSAAEHEWVIVVFDPSVTVEQRGAILQILPHLYGVEWLSFTIALPAPVSWEASADSASARLAGGKDAEIVLRKAPASQQAAASPGPRYGATDHVEKFERMHGELQAYKAGPRAFESRDSYAFVVTIELSSPEPAE
jgi:hypothetical protein